MSYLEPHPVRGRLFNEDFWGAYILRTLGRGHRIFIDGRSHLFEDAGVLRDYLQIVQAGRDAPVLLNKYGIEACLIERSTALATLLAASPGWQQVYTDNVSVLLVQRTGDVLQAADLEITKCDP